MIRMPQAASQPQTWRGFEADGPPIIARQIVDSRTMQPTHCGHTSGTTELSGAASPMSTRSDSIKSAMNPAKGFQWNLNSRHSLQLNP